MARDVVVTTLNNCLFLVQGHQELCDYCPSEFENEESDDADVLDDGYKRHHYHHHHRNRLVHATPISGDRRREKTKKPAIENDGEYEFHQSKDYKSEKSRPLHHRQRDKDDKWGTFNEPVQSALQLLKEENTDSLDTESTNYGEYKYDKMTVEDTGKYAVD